MLNHLKTSGNSIKIVKPVLNSDHDVVGEVLVGTGYGIARTLSNEELANDAFAKFSHALVMAHYAQAMDAGEEPNINMVAVWRGNDYHIGGVRQQYDIHGGFVGYVLLCNGGVNERI